MYRIGICGHFGFGKDLANGQTVKTKNIASELEKVFGENEVLKMDSSAGKKQIFKICINAFKLVKNCKNIVMLPAHNGVLVFTPLFRLFNMFFNRKLHYVVIGGWLAEFLEKHKITKRLLRGFDKIYVETSMMKAKLEKSGFKNVLVMPNFKSLETVEADKDKQHFPVRLCTFSRVIYEKGIEHSIEAAKKLNSDKITCVLDIYGDIDEEYRSRFDKVMSSVPEYINYKGCIDSNKSVNVLKDYHILLFPTLYTDVEGFPGTLIDAFAAGIPVVAFDWVNNDNIVVDGVNGLLCIHKSPDALAESIKKLIDDKELYAKLAEGTLQSSKKYSSQEVIKILTNEFI